MFEHGLSPAEWWKKQIVTAALVESAIRFKPLRFQTSGITFGIACQLQVLPSHNVIVTGFPCPLDLAQFSVGLHPSTF